MSAGRAAKTCGEWRGEPGRGEKRCPGDQELDLRLVPHVGVEVEHVRRCHGRDRGVLAEHDASRTSPRTPAAVDLLCELTGTQPTEAMHLVGWLHEALAVPGAMCEMGCASGNTSALIGHETRGSDRDFWLFDSFEGLSRPTAEDTLIHDIYDLGSMEAYTGAMAYPVESVQQALAGVGFPAARTAHRRRLRPRVVQPSGHAGTCGVRGTSTSTSTRRSPRVCNGSTSAPTGVRSCSLTTTGGSRRAPRPRWSEFVVAHPDVYEVRKPEPWAGHFVGLKRRV